MEHLGPVAHGARKFSGMKYHRVTGHGEEKELYDRKAAEKAAGAGNAAAELALECFAYRVRKYIGAYAAALGGADALVFTAGIGEHSSSMRARICTNLAFLNLHLDNERNLAANGHEPAAIGAAPDTRVWVIPTDEERQIARDTYTVLR